MVNSRRFDVDDFSKSIRDALGFGRYLCVGGAADEICSSLRNNLVDARTEEDALVHPHAVVLDLRENVDALLARLPELFAWGVRYVVVVYDIVSEAEFALRERESLEKKVISAGFRKASAYYDINPYASLNVASGCFIAPFERVADSALAEYNLEVLVEERLLHTDMLRETGRRSDAHCVRYRYAAEHIRPGDRVLDVACGLGYGSRMLFESSLAASVHGIDLSDFGVAYATSHYGMEGAVRYTVGDAENLSTIADASIDFIAAFETIEHVPNPDLYLQELKRVLAPGGRVMLCAPNDWTDETGKDPNPFHLHVYTWDKLKAEVSSYFLLEKAFIQVAGGAMKCHFSPRSWLEVDPVSPNYDEAEWVVFLGMKDPTEPGDAVFKETAWRIPTSSRFNVSAFARDYVNPWLVKAMVAIGQRSSNATMLDDFRRKVIAVGPARSVDAGAALCGQIYSLTEQADFAQLDSLHAAVVDYLGINGPKPHQRRWQVSIAYAYGFAKFLEGDVDGAEHYLSLCCAIDPVPYSPILGNKTLDALFVRAVIRVGSDDLKGARALLHRSVDLVRGWSAGGVRNSWLGSWMNVVGLSSAPLPFGLAEMALLFDKSARSAYMLSIIDSAKQRPGAFAREARGFLERQVDHLKRELRACAIANEQKTSEAIGLIGDMARLRQHADSLGEELVERNERSIELASEVRRQSDRSQELADQVVALDRHAQDIARELQFELQSRDTILADVKSRNVELMDELAVQAMKSDERLQAVVADLRRDIESRDEVIAKLSMVEEHSHRLAAQVRELDEHAQRNALELAAEIELRDRIIAELLVKLQGG